MERALGKTDLRISPVALGAWPISGMSSLGVNDADSLATLTAALDSGINFFDTAYAYGPQGESEKLIARALGHCRDEIVIATKGGIHWGPDGERMLDARPATLRRECEASLRRLRTDRVELLYLHAPDPEISISESAAALQTLMAEGKTLAVGASNVSLDQLREFHSVCPVAAVQPPYNMLQRGIENDLLPWCREHAVSVMAYWPLLKGLLAGKLSRDHVFARGDGRPKYPMFQGDEWQKNHDFVDRLREIAIDAGRTVAQVVVNWTIHQPGITAALCGAKRPDQIRETVGAMGWQLMGEQRSAIDAALQARGQSMVRGAI